MPNDIATQTEPEATKLAVPLLERMDPAIGETTSVDANTWRVVIAARVGWRSDHLAGASFRSSPRAIRKWYRREKNGVRGSTERT